MSHLYVSCLVCHRRLRIKERLRDKVIKCPICHFSFTARQTSPYRSTRTGRHAAFSSPSPPRAPITAAGAQPEEAAAEEYDIEVVDEDSSASGGPVVNADEDSHDQGPAEPRSAPEARPRASEEPSGPQGPDEPLEFRVRIKRDPYEVMKGEWKAKLTRKGLYLQQKEDREVVPVGTPAEYLADARFLVTFGGRRLEMVVHRFGYYEHRLARDVAVYLDGTKRTLRRKTYVLPWYLFVPTVLPLGLPVVVRGGLIPGGIAGGVAAALAGLSFLIVQKEDWSVPARIALVLALAVLGYTGAVAWLIVAWYFLAPAAEPEAPSP